MWLPFALGAGVSFAALSTLYRVAEVRGVAASSVGAVRLFLGACVIVPLLALVDRVAGTHPPADPTQRRFALAMAVAVPLAAAGAFGWATAKQRVDWASWGWLGLIALTGAVVVAFNVHMIASAARENLNAGFPLAVAAACYTVLAFALNVIVFDEAREGLGLYVRAHWLRIVALGLAVAAVVLMHVA